VVPKNTEEGDTASIDAWEAMQRSLLGSTMLLSIL
jgi:hypothetical protein